MGVTPAKGGAWGAALFLCLGWAVAAAGPDDRAAGAEEVGSGFVAVEAGWWGIGGSRAVTDPVVLYLNIGLSVTKEFGSESDFEPLRLGPKIGAVFGRRTSGGGTDVYYDLLLKLRFFPGRTSWMLRPYLDFGPGLITYVTKRFELEAGGGLDFRFGSASVGAGAQYKEVFGSSEYRRGVVLLGSLGYHF